MKVKLRLKSNKLVEDLHELKAFLNESKAFSKAISQVNDWVKHNYKDDILARNISECRDREEAIYCINEKLKHNLARKLKMLDPESKPRKTHHTSNPKIIIPQKRENMINKMKEVHGY